MPDAVVITALGTIAAAALALAGVWFTTRQTGKAAAAAQRLESLRDFQSTMNSIADNLRRELADERTRREQDRSSYETRLNDLVSRVTSLEAERHTQRASIAALNRYARALVALLRRHGITPPEPPEDFTERSYP